MGLVKLAVLSAGGYWAFRSVQGISRAVPACHVPGKSMLATAVSSARKEGRGTYADAYKIELPAKLRQHRPDMAQVSRGFFSCPVFYNFERHVLKLALRCPEPVLQVKEFAVGETAYVWKVEKRTREEIIMSWDAPWNLKASGTTW